MIYTVVLWFPWVTGSRTPGDTKSMVAQISHIKWHATVGPPYIQMRNPRIQRADYIYNGILFSHKKEEILPFATRWMDLEGVMLNE